MAIEPSEGAGNRATVALVYHAVEEVKELTRAGFTDMQRQLDGLSGLPDAVAGLRERTTLLERRVLTVEGLRETVNATSGAVDTLSEELRLRDERVSVAAQTLAAETERRRAELADSVAVNDHVFSSRERTVGIAAVLVSVVMGLLKTLGLI